MNLFSLYLCVHLYLFLLIFKFTGSSKAKPTFLGVSKMLDSRVRCMTCRFVKSRCAGGLSSMLCHLDALSKLSPVFHKAQGRSRLTWSFLLTRITISNSSFNLIHHLLCLCTLYPSFCLWLGSRMPSCVSGQHWRTCIKTSCRRIIDLLFTFFSLFRYSHLPVLRLFQIDAFSFILLFFLLPYTFRLTEYTLPRSFRLPSHFH